MRVRGGIVCSCAEGRERRDRLLHATSPVSAMRECQHVEAARILDLHLSESTLPKEALVHPLNLFPGFVAVSGPSSLASFAVVRRRPHIKCLDCEKTHCLHTGLYRSSQLGEADREMESDPGVQPEKTPVHTSYQMRTLPIHLPREPLPSSFSPASEKTALTCSCGKEWKEEVTYSVYQI